MTVFKDVRTLVKDSIAMSISLLKNETPTTEAVTNNEKTDVKTKQTSVISVDKANVKQAIIDSGYYQASDFTGL
jgi:putative multiple sugar transport system substrate-binding protein